MAFSPKQMLYVLSRVKRGLRPRFARALKAVQQTGGQYGAVDVNFREPFKLGAFGASGTSDIVTAKRSPVATANWEIFRDRGGQGKHELHFSGISGPGAGAVGAANVKRILKQFRGYMQGQFSRISGHRVTGVRRIRAQSMRVNVPGEGMSHVVNPRIGAVRSGSRWQRGAARTVEPPRPVVPDWNAPSIEEMKAGTARMPETWGHGHAQAVAAQIREWARSTDQIGSEAHHRFTRQAAFRLRNSNPGAFDYEAFFRAAMTGSERAPRSNPRVAYRSFLPRRRRT